MTLRPLSLSGLVVKRSVEADDHKFKSASAHFFYKDTRVKAYKDIYSRMTIRRTEEFVLVTFRSYSSNTKIFFEKLSCMSSV